MRKILYFLLLLPLLYAVRPSLKAALRHQVVIDFKNAIVPFIAKQVELLILPDIPIKVGPITVLISRIIATIPGLDARLIGINFLPNTSTLQLVAVGINMAGAAHILAKLHIITKTMNAIVVITNVGLSALLTLVAVAGRPAVLVSNLHIHMTAEHIHVQIHGDVIAQLVEILVNTLKAHFLGHVVQILESRLPREITKEIDKRLLTLPTDIDLGHSLWMHFGFSTTPVIHSDSLLTAIHAFVHPKGNPTPPPYDPGELPDFDASSPKGVQFFMSDYVVKSGLDAEFANGGLKIEFEKSILGHDVAMKCKATKAPSFVFVNTINTTLDGECEVTLDKDPKYAFGMVGQLVVSLKEYAKQATVYFTILEGLFTKLEYKTPNPIDIEWFKKGINVVLKIAIELANAMLSDRGFPLPKIHGIDYTDLVQVVKVGYLEICTTPVFHFT